ncbi:YcbK family protein [Pseudenhygromyxa sp. WMMC2535]|uniref:YcbK family protein n=1 Tax=Pseudenhygromyxa sp. WMMC2535 TaxID=2712867 RepID=UPI001556E026|nr:DUF882 domain-containing protein [Pseudenhygromyxa sp. WMMC2535]NVB41900.1 YcbK family protein [Pseudenhygromyxa sp. WMMC2535]
MPTLALLLCALTFAQEPAPPTSPPSAPPTSPPSAPPTSPPSAPPTSKKDAYIAAKTEAGAKTHAGRPARRGQRADRPVWANNLRTHEIRALTGPAGIDSQRERSDFFRCWFTHEHGPIPEALVARVISAAEHFEVREVRVISGFRHPKYNLLLRKKGNEVAAKSQHTEGMAIDFYLPGVPIRALYDWLLDVHEGGVGFYPISEFVHVDLGRKRTWKGT